ncbi:MAG TPA: sodium-dependent bicarbonate transport family permease, partial [Acidobacteriota bacterium]|nr:sodium-dependent bicarbonate transport family permease [Acidobacteriota bacterium]
MDILLSPLVLFFVLGMLAALLSSDLEVPVPISKFLSLYLLLAIGFHGGFKLREAGLQADAIWTLAAAMGMALLIPLGAYGILRRRL